MNTLLQLSALVGALLPIAVALVKAQHWSNRLKSFVGLVMCAGAAGLTAWATGKLHGLAVAESFAVIYAATQTTYIAFWKPTGADGWLAQIGIVFSPPKPVVEPLPPPAGVRDEAKVTRSTPQK